MNGRSIILEDFLDFENHFTEFINRTVLFKTVKKAQFIVYNENFTEITYTHKYDCADHFEMSDIKKILKTAEVIEAGDNVSILLCKEEELNCDYNRYMINVINPTSKRLILGTLFICCNKCTAIRDASTFNIHYLQQLIFHIQSVITNYDKLYHIIDIFTELIVAKDQFMPYHMTNVAQICIQLSSYLNLSAKEQMLLYYSALLHDIGKLFISDSILNKPTGLTDEEYARIKSHSNKGSEIIMATLHGMTLLNEIPEIVRHHHENYDGTGYPDKLKRTKIPYLSRILRVADTVDAMSSRRAYGEAQSLNTIVKELKKCSGKQYDPIITKAMVKLLLDDIEDIEKGHIDSNVFIPQASLSFLYSINGELKSLLGNLVVKNNKGRFISHDTDKSVYSVHAIHKATISFMKQQNLIEHTINVSHYSNGTYYIDNFIPLPTDRTFSMIWNSATYLINRDTDEIKMARIVKLGGDSVVLQFSRTDGEDLIRQLHDAYQVKLTESVKDTKIDLTISLRFVKFYRQDNSVIFISRFTDIQPGQKDKILRILFRKQIENRKVKAKMRDSK